MRLYPDKRKIKSVLGYIEPKVYDYSVGSQIVTNILYVANIMHLNNYGRFIFVYNWQAVYNNIRAEYTYKIMHDKINYKFDEDAVSKSDLKYIDDAILLWQNFPDFTSLIKSNYAFRQAVNKGMGTYLEFEDMYLGKNCGGLTEDQKEEVMHMLVLSNKMCKDEEPDHFNLNDIKDVTNG